MKSEQLLLILLYLPIRLFKREIKKCLGRSRNEATCNYSIFDTKIQYSKKSNNRGKFTCNFSLRRTPFTQVQTHDLKTGNSGTVESSVNSMNNL